MNPVYGELLWRNAEVAITKVVSDLGDRHANKGGYFRALTLSNNGSGYAGLAQICHGWIGRDANREKYHKYEVISFEKAIRLANNFALSNHVSSWQSRDTEVSIGTDAEVSLYGGAILVRCRFLGEMDGVFLVLSFSGLPELSDEATMILTALLGVPSLLGSDVLSQLRHIATISNNLAAHAIMNELPR